MAITIEIMEGPLKGMEFELHPGMRIGRSGADLNLKDPKVSSMHAEVRVRAGSVNTLVLVDLGSTNGIKINGTKTNSIELKPGMLFQLGNTFIKVGYDASKDATQNSQLSDWRAHLIRAVSKLPIPSQPKTDLKAFEPILRLTFIEGPQVGEEILIGYGPRMIGKKSAEINLTDPAAAEVSFQFLPLQNGVVEFRTDNSDLIFLNGLSKDSEKIKTGDKLKVGNTVIEINFGT